MTTTATTYFGNRARAAVVPAGGTPALANLFTVGRGFDVEISWDTAELYGIDSILRVDEAKYQLQDAVSQGHIDQLTAAIKAGTITPTQARTMLKNANETTVQRQFTYLPLWRRRMCSIPLRLRVFMIRGSSNLVDMTCARWFIR